MLRCGDALSSWLSGWLVGWLAGWRLLLASLLLIDFNNFYRFFVDPHPMFLITAPIPMTFPYEFCLAQALCLVMCTGSGWTLLGLRHWPFLWWSCLQLIVGHVMDFRRFS